MTGFTFDCTIDGQGYSVGLLETIAYHRNLHVLHQMKRAGARILLRGTTLTDDEIDLLTAEEASQASMAVRNCYDQDGIRTLFKDQLAASEQRWRDWNDASRGLPPQTCVADITITGISFEEFSEAMSTQGPFLDDYPSVHPDHFSIGKSDGILRGIETFGMYGGPSEMCLIPVPDLKVPIERDQSYPYAFGAEASLVDGTNTNVPAFMQFKPTDTGLMAKVGCCFPAKVPKELVEGHKLHLSLEFLGFAKAVVASRVGKQGAVEMPPLEEGRAIGSAAPRTRS